VELGGGGLDHAGGGGDGERVVADPRPAQPPVLLDDCVRHVRCEDRVDVGEQREPERRLAEPPDEVSGLVARALAGRAAQPFLEPGQACLLAACRRRDLCDCDRVAFNRRDTRPIGDGRRRTSVGGDPGSLLV